MRMSSSEPSSRLVTVLIVVLLAVGACMVLGWLFRAALVALGIAMKLGGLVLIGVLIYLLVRALSKKS